MPEAMDYPTATTARRPRRGPLLAALLAGTALLAMLAVYAGGFACLRDDVAFSERLVTHAWHDVRFSAVFADLFPGEEVRFRATSSGMLLEELTLTLVVKDHPERSVVRWLSALSDLRIRRVGAAIEVSEPSWLWHVYAALDSRIYGLCGASPWRRKRPLEDWTG